MPQTTISLLIAAGILVALTLADPCINSIAAMLRRTAQKRIADADAEVAPQSGPSYKRDVA